jgi:hypothetical protein
MAHVSLHIRFGKLVQGVGDTSWLWHYVRWRARSPSVPSV